MKIHRLLIAAASVVLATSAWAQGTPAGSANSAGVPPPVPPVPPPTAASNPEPAPVPNSIAAPVPNPAAAQVQEPEPPPPPNLGANEGFFRPAPEAIVVPAFPPGTPGVTPMDTGTSPVVGSSTADRELRDAVASAISSDSQLQGARINVLVSDGAVTLTGTAKDLAQVERARTLAERLAGAAQVISSITTG